MQYVDPLEEEQIEWLKNVLKEPLSPKTLLGLLIIGPRMVDNFGHQRIFELEQIFKTDTPGGRKSLVSSLEYVATGFNSIEDFGNAFPISIIPPKPAYPMLKIIGINKLANELYRVFDSRLTVFGTSESVKDYILRTGRIPAVPKIKKLIRRTKPRVHWCSYTAFSSPEETARALQIKPEWSDCKLRVTLLTLHINSSSYLAYNGDKPSVENDFLEFSGYFTEPLAQDHPPLAGGGPQIAVTGSPAVSVAELWNDEEKGWEVIFKTTSVK